MPPSAIFYDDILQPCAQNGTVSWSRLPNSQLPLVFFGGDSEEVSVDEVQSFISEFYFPTNVLVLLARIVVQ